MGGKVGAPLGGRVHWVLWNLPVEFKRAYKLRFDYEYHNYNFVRYVGRVPIDQFIIIRTSRKCFRCMYYNFDTDYFEYFSEPTAEGIANRVVELYEKIRQAERRNAEKSDKN